MSLRPRTDVQSMSTRASTYICAWWHFAGIDGWCAHMIANICMEERIDTHAKRKPIIYVLVKHVYMRSCIHVLARTSFTSSMGSPLAGSTHTGTTQASAACFVSIWMYEGWMPATAPDLHTSLSVYYCSNISDVPYIWAYKRGWLRFRVWFSFTWEVACFKRWLQAFIRIRPHITGKIVKHSLLSLARSIDSEA